MGAKLGFFRRNKGKFIILALIFFSVFWNIKIVFEVAVRYFSKMLFI
jgi:hypothetical protein